jgi:hypothetical protein
MELQQAKTELALSGETQGFERATFEQQLRRQESIVSELQNRRSRPRPPRTHRSPARREGPRSMRARATARTAGSPMAGVASYAKHTPPDELYVSAATAVAERWDEPRSDGMSRGRMRKRRTLGRRGVLGSGTTAASRPPRARDASPRFPTWSESSALYDRLHAHRKENRTRATRIDRTAIERSAWSTIPRFIGSSELPQFADFGTMTLAVPLSTALPDASTQEAPIV